MSYILDAIKKADQKRELGTVPDVNTVHETPPIVEPRRSGWLYGVAAILIVNALAIGWWLWPGSGAKTPVAEKPGQSAVVETVAKTTAPAPPPAAKVEPPPTPTPVASESPPPQPPPPPVQTEIQPASKPVNPFAAVQAGEAKPPVVAPPPPAPADQTAALAEKESAAPADLARPGVPPPAVKVEQPAKPAVPVPSAPSAPPAPQAAQAPTLPATKKPVNPFAAQVEAAKAVKPPPVPSPPSDAAKALAIAFGAKGNGAPPKADSPAPDAATAGVVPVLKPEEPVASSPEEPLVEAEDASAVTGAAEAEASADEQGLAPIAVSSQTTKGKAKKSGRAEKEDEDPELAKIPFFKQLPPDIQQAIPELHISFHSYSIKPSARLVSISGKILREGDSYDENVKLETITVKGVVLVCKGRRFRLGV